MSAATPGTPRPKLELAHHEARADDIPAFCALAATEYPGEPVTDVDYVVWKHLRGPDGPSTAIELKAGDAVKGRIWGQRRRWRVHGREHAASNPIDLVIEPDARALPSLLRLLKGSFAIGMEEADLIFHTSSTSTDMMYRRFMHLTPVADLDGGVIALRPAHLLSARGKRKAGPLARAADAVFGLLAGGVARVLGRSIALVPEVEPAEDARIIAAFHAEEAVAGVRDVPWRDWRLRDPSIAGYSFRWIVAKDRPVGWLAVADREVDGMQLRFVLDVIAPGAVTSGFARSLWSAASADALAAGRDAIVVLANFGGNERLSGLARLPLIRVARSRLPQEVPLFVRWSENARGDEPDLGVGYWTMSDFDMI
ncbi:MAG: hypothetical protein ACJ762_05285 [Solirubrobacteraceae bacterium]